MPRISQWIEKLENLLLAKLKKHKKKLQGIWPLLLIGLYLYGVFVNSIRLGIASTFPEEGAPPIKSIWEWNPVLSLAAIFTPTGIGVTLFIILMACLISKKGYSLLSGYKAERDTRGFDILKDGTHGTSGWMKRAEMTGILQKGKAEELTGTILGRLEEENENGDDYLAPKENHGLVEHFMVFGSTGSGKSRGFVIPFLLQAARRQAAGQAESVIVVDPKAELYEKTAGLFRGNGYVVRSFNLLDLESSDGLNCIHDIEQDPDLVHTIAEIIIQNTSNSKDRQNYWETAEHNLLRAMLYYMADAADDNGKLLPIEQRSLGAIYHMLAGDSFNLISERIKKLDAGHPAKAPFDLIREAPVQNRANIVMGLGNRLGVFQNKLVDTITRHNDIDLTLPGMRPCAYYCIISDQESSLEFLSSLFFSLLFSRLSNHARRHCPGGKLPIKVNILMEEFCNIGYLGESFLRTLNVVRSKNIFCQIVAQGVAQLANRYPRGQWEELIGACDWRLLLGCNDLQTAKYWSDNCGMVTIRTDSGQMPQQPLFSPIYSSTRPYSITRSATQRPLMMPDEILRMDNKKGILQIRGQKPLELYKISPEDLPGFADLVLCRAVEHIPAWRVQEEELAAASKTKTKARKKPADVEGQLRMEAVEPDEQEPSEHKATATRPHEPDPPGERLPPTRPKVPAPESAVGKSKKNENTKPEDMPVTVVYEEDARSIVSSLFKENRDKAHKLD